MCARARARARFWNGRASVINARLLGRPRRRPQTGDEPLLAALEALGAREPRVFAPFLPAARERRRENNYDLEDQRADQLRADGREFFNPREVRGRFAASSSLSRERPLEPFCRHRRTSSSTRARCARRFASRYLPSFAFAFSFSPGERARVRVRAARRRPLGRDRRARARCRVRGTLAMMWRVRISPLNH